MRITRARQISQWFFFGLFVFLVLVADVRHLKGYPVSIFLELDPLNGLGMALAGRELYRGMLWGLLLVAVTVLLGRVFCGWACPFGSIHHFTGWLFRPRRLRARIEANRYRSMYQIKYYVLFAMLVAALFGSLQTGWLDPISLLHRSMAAALLPAVNRLAPGLIHVRETVAAGAWVIGLLFVFFVAMNAVIPRFFCRVLCPLGALLGLLSRFALWRIDRNPSPCSECDACLAGCEGAADPHSRLRKSECFVCFNCLDDCGPGGVLDFRFLPRREREVTDAQFHGRRATLAAMSGLLFYAFGRSTGAATKTFSPAVIRPPGSLGEPEFLERCLKCDQCLRVCPTNVLQPAAWEAGLEGVWTPILNMRAGHCEVNCTLCGQVCPTGAIQRITLEEKRGVGASAERGPIRIGTAFVDRTRCLPWAMDTHCVVCEEVCPTSPKAIFTREERVVGRDGAALTLSQPYVDPRHCIGCGICEHECPVRDLRAIRVTAIGETRSRDRSLLLESAG